ncbi:hypothetical protein ACIO3O_35660 [Streptomyces sp. NPDC087440]|uniref:hypothetical protein n=1 Tax=Streptomyces sp. NPDC087440 TaxID=3365790 RepID=UPI00381AE827
MGERLLVGGGSLVLGVVLVLTRGAFARRATGQRNVFGRANARHPGAARTMPVVVGGLMALMGVLVLVGVIGVA